MDNTIRNVSELEKALQILNTDQPSINTPQSTNNSFITKDFNSTNNIPSTSTSLILDPVADTNYLNQTSTSKSRIGSNNHGTNSLLHNLCGHQNNTNSKLDMLLDSSIRNQQLLEQLLKHKEREIQLLEMIARNTISTSNQQNNISGTFENTSSNKGTVKDYGFMNTQAIVVELLIKLIKEIEIKLNSRGLRYRSTRILEVNVVAKAINIACNNEFRISGEIKKSIIMPKNTDKTAVYLASKIGSKGGLNPILNVSALKEIFDDPNCRGFISIIQDIIERIKIIAIILPFYEADIIRAIHYPYFDSEEQLVCDWNKIQKRNETSEEALVAQCSITIKGKIGTLIAKGVNVKSALKAVIKDSSN